MQWVGSDADQNQAKTMSGASSDATLIFEVQVWILSWMVPGIFLCAGHLKIPPILSGDGSRVFICDPTKT